VILALGGLALGLGALGFFVHHFGARPPRAPPTALTAVVLGARIYPDGTPSQALVDRVRLGVELLRRGHATRLVLSGGTPDTRPAEAEVMRRLALSLGAQDQQLVLESSSRSTFENARASTPLLESRELILVTCDFHLARATAHFRAHHLTIWPWPSPRKLRAADRLMVTAKEVIGLLRRPWLLWRLVLVARRAR
jgi:uncharacterized SAM-binding protein YcdF (DUF218 family)